MILYTPADFSIRNYNVKPSWMVLENIDYPVSKTSKKIKKSKRNK